MNIVQIGNNNTVDYIVIDLSSNGTFAMIFSSNDIIQIKISDKKAIDISLVGKLRFTVHIGIMTGMQII